MKNTNVGKPFILGKIYNNPDYAKALLDGKVFINPLSTFGVGNLFDNKEEMKNKARGDLNEGLSSNASTKKPVNCSPVQFFQDIGGIPREADSIGEIDTRFLIENITCFTALFYDESSSELQKLNNKLANFTDGKKGSAIVIYDVKEFLRRVMNVLSDSLGSPYWVAYGLVDYSFNKNDNTQTDEFTKESSYAYQQEFRIAINLQKEGIRLKEATKDFTFNPDIGSILLNIGSIDDIAFTLPVEDYIDLNFPAQFSHVKTRRPENIVPFYPPVKNEITYLCPLMRVGKKIYISDRALRPAKRNTNAYVINMPRLEETRFMSPSSDDFFLSILESFYSRILDIYKSMNDHSIMEQVCTAFSTYLLLIGVKRCAGIELIRLKDGYHPSYNDFDIHDLKLQNSDSYRLIERKILPPPPTDFAVMITLSDETKVKEYEYEGKKYVMIKAARDGILPSGRIVKKDELLFFEVSPVTFLGY